MASLLQMETPMTSLASLWGAKTIEFVGVGQAGKRRPIDAFEDISQGSLRRLNLVAPPDHDWEVLFNQWAFSNNRHVSVSIRHGNEIALTLQDVLALHFAVTSFDTGAGWTAKAFITLCSQRVVFARAQPVIASALDRYMPASVRRAIFPR